MNEHVDPDNVQTGMARGPGKPRAFRWNGKAIALAALLAAGAAWRLFDFGKVDAQVRQAKGAYAEALADYRESTLKAVQDVEDAFMRLAQTRLRTEELEQEVSALNRARDLSEKAYRAGSITLTDVLDADRQLPVSRDALDASKADAARAAVRAFSAMGGGWDAPQPIARAEPARSPGTN
jgi:outer membrane protein TolC